MFNTEYSTHTGISQRLVTLRSNAQHAFYLSDNTRKCDVIIAKNDVAQLRSNAQHVFYKSDNKCDGILSVKHRIAADG